MSTPGRMEQVRVLVAQFGSFLRLGKSSGLLGDIADHPISVPGYNWTSSQNMHVVLRIVRTAYGLFAMELDSPRQ